MFSDDINFLNKITQLKKNNLTIGICHGCFDVLHFGHIIHFKEARSLCDYLVVSITPDEYIRKGPGRPIFSTSQRKTVLQELSSIDLVVIHRDLDSRTLLESTKPDFYFKGADYVGGNYNKLFDLELNVAKKNNIEVVFTKGDRSSSTWIIDRLKEGI